MKLVGYNMSPCVEAPVIHFLKEYVIIRDNFWNQFRKSNSFDSAFNIYYQYAKNKCALIDSLLENLNFAIRYDPLRNDLYVIMKDGFTF